MSPRPPPGAWTGANGPRVLTDAQRERKRERDRATKREEKVKNAQRLQELEETKKFAAKRIKELEAQVESLTKSCRCRASRAIEPGSENYPGQSHSYPQQCQPSSSLPYDETSSQMVPSPRSSTGSLGYHYGQEPMSDYSGSAYSPEHYDMPYGSQAPGLPYSTQAAPQSYSAASSAPTTWATTLHSMPAITHSYSSGNAPGTPLASQHARTYSWDSQSEERRPPY